MPEEDISFRRLLHELWKSWEEKTGVVSTAVGSEVEAALVPWGFACPRSLFLGGGQGLPLAACCSSRQGVLEEPLVQIHPSLGQFAFQQSRLVHAG